METKSWTYNIDIVGGCNLKCPSCPVGNMPKANRAKGLMNVEMFEDIIKKIKQETPNVAYVGVYNWAEPTIHPHLPEMIAIARRYDVPISLSSNFNTDRNLEELVRAEPYSFRASVSGYSQEYYGRTHAKGNIENVKSNMRKLREIMDRLGSQMEVHVAYHCYKDNMGEEYESMKALCGELRFYFLPVFAVFMPVEKMVEYYEHGEQVLSESDKRVMDLLAIHPDEYREVSIRQYAPDCELRSNRTAINWDGSVALCCGVYDFDNNIAPSFLDTSHEELQKRKYEHPFCDKCMKHGLHATYLYDGSQQWIQYAKKRVAPQKIPKELVRAQILMGWRQRLNRTLGVTAVDKIVHIARKALFRG
jgi:MoaA/NifB/PqqE/SkfB family radical SAM enzyme